MNDTEFHRLADLELTTIFDRLEEADRQGHLEVEYEGGILTIGLPDGKQCIISKHAPSHELWLSSPLSGGLHFAAANGQWRLSDGRTLDAVLMQDLQALSSLKVTG